VRPVLALRAPIENIADYGRLIMCWHLPYGTSALAAFQAKLCPSRLNNHKSQISNGHYAEPTHLTTSVGRSSLQRNTRRASPKFNLSLALSIFALKRLPLFLREPERHPSLTFLTVIP
jgi:hypothetical protein